jgi:hypothetical protein
VEELSGLSCRNAPGKHQILLRVES